MTTTWTWSKMFTCDHTGLGPAPSPYRDPQTCSHLFYLYLTVQGDGDSGYVQGPHPHGQTDTAENIAFAIPLEGGKNWFSYDIVKLFIFRYIKCWSHVDLYIYDAAGALCALCPMNSDFTKCTERNILKVESAHWKDLYCSCPRLYIFIKFNNWNTFDLFRLFVTFWLKYITLYCVNTSQV